MPDGSSADREGASPWRSAAAQVLVDDLAAPELDGDSAHHLGRVLRLRAGDEVCATDGRGGWRRCNFDGRAGLEPDGEVERTEALEYPVTVGFALVKGAKPELVVQKLTELGVDRIVVFAAARSVVRWDGERSTKQFDRLARVARAACAQCRRLWLPEVAPGSLSELVAEGAVVADAGGRAMRRSDRTVLVGPEGGWTTDELRGSDGAPVATVGMAEHVLRAETAAITAGVLLTTLRAGLVAEA